MQDIFTDKNLYPHEGKIKEHFKGFFDTCFVAFIPFFRVENYKKDTKELEKLEKQTFEQAKNLLYASKNDIIKAIDEISTPNNKYFPSDDVIYKRGQLIHWKTIIKGSKIKDYAELNKALRSSIGALRPVFDRQDLLKRLNDYTIKENIWHPTEGEFDVFSKLLIYKTLKLFNKNRIIVTDEFFEKQLNLDISTINEFEFSEKICSNDYYIYSDDKEILFTIEWDSFFFLIATDRIKMDIIAAENLYEGFLCNSDTTHDWDYAPGELENYLRIEKEQLGKKSKKDKTWWKFWLN